MKLTDLDRVLFDVIDGLSPMIHDRNGVLLFLFNKIDAVAAEALLGPETGMELTADQRVQAGQWLFEYLWQSGHDATFASEYSEPGYTSPDSPAGIVFCDWNPPVAEEIGNLLELLGWELEWSDEWCTCSNCNKAVRTQADSYNWTPHYYEAYGTEPICFECVLDDDGETEEYLAYLCGNENRAMHLALGLSEFGYVKIDADWESGFHHGQNADPRKIAKELIQPHTNRFIFEVDSVGQFDVSFSVWVDKESAEAVQAAVDKGDMR